MKRLLNEKELDLIKRTIVAGRLKKPEIMKLVKYMELLEEKLNDLDPNWREECQNT